MKQERVERDDFQAGYNAGWDANNRYRREQHELKMDLGAPGGSVMSGGLMAVFGALFLLSLLSRLYRGWEVGRADWLFAIVPLTIAFLILRSVPKARREARAAAAAFKAKWGA